MTILRSYIYTDMEMAIKCNFNISTSTKVQYMYRAVVATVIFLPAHPASFTHNFVSGMQNFHSGGSQDAMILAGLQ